MVVDSHTEAQKVAGALVRKYLDRLTSQVQRTAQSAGANEVHDLRVAIRRLGQVLRLFHPCFPAKEVKRVQRSLKKHIALAGEVRDLDVVEDFLSKSKLAEASSLREKFHGRRKEAGKTLEAKLQHWNKRRTYSKWRRRLIASPADLSANETLPDLLDRFASLGNRAARGPADMEKLHEVRITGKKLRYTLEIFAPSAKQIAQLKKLQGILGDMHDAEIVREMLREEDGAGRLVAQITRKRNRSVVAFRSCWKAEFANLGSLRKPPVRSDLARSSVHAVAKAARVAD